MESVQDFCHFNNTFYEMVGRQMWVFRVFVNHCQLSSQHRLSAAQFAVEVVLPRHVIAGVDLIGKCQLSLDIIKDVCVLFAFQELFLCVLY